MLKLSVVLATYNRAETLRRTLDCLRKQDLDPACYEVLVVDDGSPDQTARVVAEVTRTAPHALHYLRHSNRGPGFTQNRGIREAKGSIVLLMADDIWLCPGALKAHVDCHEQHPQPHIAVLGKVLQSPEMNETVFQRHWDPFGFCDLDQTRELPFTMFWVCNVSVKRDFMLQLGMFRETVGRAGPSDHHDVEVGYRLHRHGMRLLYNQEALGYHFHPSTLGQMIDRYYERGLNWPAFRALVPDPEVLVLGRLLSLRTLPAFVRVLRGPNTLSGRERSLTWHIVRALLRGAAFNRLTVPCLWKPLVNRAETSPRLARLMNRRLYRALMYYHFLRGVRHARKRFADE
jgi:glycosyltransferase involved in cell wall biosynthesis